MNDYKSQLKTVLFDLKSNKHCLLPKYASELQDMIERYVSGDIELPPMPDDAETLSTPDTIGGGIVIIDVNGVICKRLGLPKEILDFFGLVDLDEVDLQLKAALADESVTAVILNVCSPGGFLSGVQTTANLVGKLASQKEVVVYSDVLNASAAYWISSQASSIIVSEDAEVGSVGVYMTLEAYSKMLDEQGIKVNLIKAGKWKALGDPTQPLTDEHRAFLQDEINQTWALFKASVNTKRGIADEDLQGQTFSGRALLTKDFVDGFADDLDELIGEMVNASENTIANI